MSGNGSGATLIVGATGTVGRHVCACLRGTTVIAATRSGAAPSDARGVHFDWYDDSTWNAALEGVHRMYLIAPGGDGDPIGVMRPFVDRALATGVTRAVLQSSSLLEPGSPGLGRVHELIAGAVPEWAVLRPSWFMHNFTGQHLHAESIRRDGRITSATGDARVAFVDAQDVARVAATVLTADDALNRDPILTGPAALSYDDVAAIISRTSGRSVTHVAVDERRLRTEIEAGGLPSDYAAMLAGLDVLIAKGAEDRVTDEVLRLTGTGARSFEDFAATASW